MKLTRRITGVFKQGPIYFCLMGLVIILALYFRFYNYTDRLSIHTDNGRDAQIAKFALDNLIIPQIGPFSQAPFFFGPWWYWFLALTYLLPLGVFSPWYVYWFSLYNANAETEAHKDLKEARGCIHYAFCHTHRGSIACWCFDASPSCSSCWFPLQQWRLAWGVWAI